VGRKQVVLGKLMEKLRDKPSQSRRRRVVSCTDSPGLEKRRASKEDNRGMWKGREAQERVN
jgi:hypothetical protein